jgi:protein tyrosine phosphatase
VLRSVFLTSLPRKGDVLDIPVDNEAEDGFKGEVKVERVSRDDDSGIRGRDLRLSTSSTLSFAPRTQIIHYKFSAWADHSVPSAKELLHLINMVTSPLEDPVIVHCSAGCGRTGTSIALHYLLGRLRAGELDGVDGEDDPVMEVVGEMRRQRMAMVQKEEQFLFLYEVLRGKMEKRRGMGQGSV